MSYSAEKYDGLSYESRTLYNFLVNYQTMNGGRRASNREMMAACDMHRVRLAASLGELQKAGLYRVDQKLKGSRNAPRAYQLPGERASHPHTATLEARRSFPVGRTI